MKYLYCDKIQYFKKTSSPSAKLLKNLIFVADRNFYAKIKFNTYLWLDAKIALIMLNKVRDVKPLTGYKKCVPLNFYC